MAEFVDDFPPLFPDETEAVIHSRMVIHANEGLTPDDPRWTDTREGSVFWICTRGSAREDALATDRLNEAAAASSPQWAWGPYLDDVAESLQLERLSATAAEGVARFTGPNGQVISIGTVVTVVPDDPSADAAEFSVTAAGTLAEALDPGVYEATLPIRALVAGTAGNVAAEAITGVVTPLPGVEVLNAAAMFGGTDTETDEALRVRVLEQFKGRGWGNAADYQRWASAWEGVGRVTIVPLFDGPGTVLVVIADAAGAPVAASTVDGLQANLDPPAYTSQLNGAVTLPHTPITVDSTAGARASGFIRVGDQLVAYTGLTGTTFTGCTGGTGVIADNTAVNQGGAGGGVAPIGHNVVVRTTTVLDIDVDATVECEPGFSLDGFGGTTAVLDVILAALSGYISAVPSGGEVVLTQVSSRIVGVRGVHDIAGLTLNGSAANVPVPSLPPQFATLGDTSGIVEGAV